MQDVDGCLLKMVNVGGAVLNILIILFMSILSGLLYRAGGSAKVGKWYDFVLNTKARDAGVPAIFVITMILLGHWHWSLILCFGALWGACTTYNKWVCKLFGRKDKSKVYWEGWFITGLFYGLSTLPLIIATGDNYTGLFVRSIVLAVITCLWSESIGSDEWEEFGRGFVIIATIPLLFV